MAALAVIATASAACTGLDGLTTTGEENAPEDDVRVGRRRPHPDASWSGDVVRPDAAGDDGEAPVPEADGGTSWCRGLQLTFCADFDDSLEAGWSSRMGIRGGTRLTEGGVSEPNAYSAVTNAVDGGVARAYLRKDFTVPPQQEITCAFSVRIEESGAMAQSGGTLAVVQLGQAPGEYELQLGVFANGRTLITERGPSIEGGPRKYVEHQLPSLGSDAWRRVTVRVDLRGQGAFTVSIDGKDYLVEVPAAAPLPKVPPSFYLGVTYVDPPSGPWDVRYDDVTVNVQ